LLQLGFHLVLGWPLQRIPRRFRQVFGRFDQVGHDVDSEDEFNAIGIPTVQFLALREVGVAAHQNPLKTRLAAQVHRPVEVGCRPLVRWTIATSVGDEQGLAGIGQ